MMKKLLIALMTATALCAGCGGSETQAPAQDATPKQVQKVEVRRIDQDKAMEMLANDPKAKLLDCRFPKDYELKHIPGAINYPLEFAVADNFEQIPDKDATLITYCGDGNRGGLTAKALMEKGYTNVYTMGGIIDWKGDYEGSAVSDDSAKAQADSM